MYSKPEYLNLRSTIGSIYKEGGILQFWRGLAPRMLRIVCKLASPREHDALMHIISMYDPVIFHISVFATYCA